MLKADNKMRESKMLNENYGLVSIIMPAFNCEQFINASILSIIKQTYNNWELIIVDDCSTDTTLNIVKSFKDKRIRLFKNEKNYGAAFSRNKALREAKGDWIAFLDADDIWESNKLKDQIKFMVDNNYDFTYTYYFFCENGFLGKYIVTAPKVMTYKKLLRYCYISTDTIVYNNKNIGPVQISNLKKRNDYALWLKILKNNKGYLFPKCLSCYNKHSGSISSVGKLKLIKYHYVLFKEELHFSKIKSFFATMKNLWFGFWKHIFYRKRISKKLRKELFK